MLGNLRPIEIIVIALVILVLFGAKRMPDAARSLGRSMRIFKSEVKEMRADDEDDKDRPAGSSTEAQAPARPLEGRVESPSDRRVGETQHRDVS